MVYNPFQGEGASKDKFGVVRRQKQNNNPSTPTTTQTPNTKKKFNTSWGAALQANKDAGRVTTTSDNVSQVGPTQNLKKKQADLAKRATTNPQSVVTNPDTARVRNNPNQYINPGTGQLGAVTPGQAETVDNVSTADAPEKKQANTYEAEQVSDQVKEVTDNMEAAQGEVSEEATVQGQMSQLMQDFEDGKTPPWAAGALRNAQAVMQSRGLGASSMAGSAIVQAAMESALPIALQDAQTYAEMDRMNLSARQQTTLEKSRMQIEGLFTDAAAKNAEKQFNASSKNQVEQFYDSLTTQVDQFNSAQRNAIEQFNAGEKNAYKKFAEELKAQRSQFNASNSLIIAQANAQWRQNIAALETGNQHEVNMETARIANDISQQTLDFIWQRERDIMNFAFQSSENEADRALELFLGEKTFEEYDKQRDAADRAGLGQIIGDLSVELVDGIF